MNIACVVIIRSLMMHFGRLCLLIPQHKKIIIKWLVPANGNDRHLSYFKYRPDAHG